MEYRVYNPCVSAGIAANLGNYNLLFFYCCWERSAMNPVGRYDYQVISQHFINCFFALLCFFLGREGWRNLALDFFFFSSCLLRNVKQCKLICKGCWFFLTHSENFWVIYRYFKSDFFQCAFACCIQSPVMVFWTQENITNENRD